MAANVDDAFGGYFRYWVYFLVIYPIHQVMLAYLLIFIFVGLLIYYSKEISWDLLDVVLIGGGSFIYWRSHGSFLADVKRRIVSFFEYLISRKTSQYRWKVDDWRIFLLS